jgi:fructose-bisphosphate aldolase class II
MNTQPRLAQILDDARNKGIAVPHFNVADVAQLNAVVESAVVLHAPVVIGVSEGERAFWHPGRIAALIRHIREKEGVPIFLNADHTHSIEKIKEAVEAGFDAVLYDAGKKPLDQNIQETKQVVAFVREYNQQHNTHILVEGELGYIGSGSMILDDIPEGAAVQEKDMTSVQDAIRYVQETGVDLLAPAVGNLHGMFSNAANPAINIARIKELAAAVPAHLVLHGGSGIVAEQFLQAISAGVAMIHISTELRAAWRRGIDLSLLSHSNEIAPYKIYPEAVKEVKKVVDEKIQLFYHYGRNQG